MKISHAQQRWSSRVIFIVLLLMPVWFPFVYTGAVLLQNKFIGGGAFTGPLSMRGLYFLVFIVAAIGTWPLFNGTHSASFGKIVWAVFYYIFALVISYMTAWMVTIQAFGP